MAYLLRCTLAVTALFTACSRPAATPEDQVRAVITAAATAARGKDLGAFKAIISEDYRDAEGRDKKGLKAILAYYFLQHQSVHLLTRVQALTLSSAGRATATIIAAMAGTELPEGSLLPSLDAEMYRIDADFALEGGDWRLTRAAWRPATTDDFE